ncbi:MAG: RidA family protein [Geminicoccaceae bacterium]
MHIKKKTLCPEVHSRPIGAYSPGMSLKLSDQMTLVFVAGQVATDEDGQVLHPSDAAGQTRIVFERIASVLDEAGGDLSHLVSLTIYVTDLADFDAVSGIRNEILGRRRLAPASALVQVAGLVEAGCLVEISAIAAL